MRWKSQKKATKVGTSYDNQDFKEEKNTYTHQNAVGSTAF